MAKEKTINNTEGPSKFKRDENGLVETVQYQFDQVGRVNWRAMVKEEYLYPNKDWFESRDQEVPESIEGLEDNQLLIKLGGIRDLALLRGFNSVDLEVENVKEGHVRAICRINFIENYESEETLFTGVANATWDNVNGFCEKFLESIAENRAYIRCVRNFLNIPIVGADEIDGSPNKKVDKDEPGRPANTGPQASLKKKAEKNGYPSFEEFKDFLREKWKSGEFKDKNTKSWSDFSDIPAKQARVLLNLIQK